MGYKITDNDIDEIKRLYVDEKLSSTQIGKKFGVSHRTILNWLDKCGIDRRTLSESQYAFNGKTVPWEFASYEVMNELYIDRHMTKEQLGMYFDCAPHVIDRVLRELNIPVRGASEAKIGVQRGEAHHNWKGGLSSLDALCREFFQTNISPKIRERDNYTCQLCGSHSNLHVHHEIPFSKIISDILSEHPLLDPEKDKLALYEIIISDERFNDEDNLTTYCADCHFYKIHKYSRQSAAKTQ